jgi:hypothetical protein
LPDAKYLLRRYLLLLLVAVGNLANIVNVKAPVVNWKSAELPQLIASPADPKYLEYVPITASVDADGEPTIVPSDEPILSGSGLTPFIFH